ncbi:MAG: DUF429 domain-containing protein [Chloroflexota bacterium]|nr:DUF429 domain-containing protein [Chloroflexota bacterium]
MTTVIGIDYSGAKHDRDTWVAQGELKADSTIELWSAYPTIRRDVVSLLMQVSTPAIAGIDFPFCVPTGFIKFLYGDCNLTEMSEVWKIIGSLEQEDFIARRDSFIEKIGYEPKRAGDKKYFRESFSPLHDVRPNMIPMTYYGINMLCELHDSHPGRWIVPPLQSPSDMTGNTVTLLETMPGAFLKAIGARHKGYKTTHNAIENREGIIEIIERRFDITLPSAMRMGCLANDDCLDAMVAAVAAASWAQDATQFRHPTRDELSLAKLEGWIYVPQTDA